MEPKNHGTGAAQASNGLKTFSFQLNKLARLVLIHRVDRTKELIAKLNASRVVLHPDASTSRRELAVASDLAQCPDNRSQLQLKVRWP